MKYTYKKKKKKWQTIFQLLFFLYKFLSFYFPWCTFGVKAGATFSNISFGIFIIWTFWLNYVFFYDFFASSSISWPSFGAMVFSRCSTKISAFYLFHLVYVPFPLSSEGLIWTTGICKYLVAFFSFLIFRVSCWSKY